MEIARDALVATSVSICGKKLYHKVKNWYYHKEDIEITAKSAISNLICPLLTIHFLFYPSIFLTTSGIPM